MASLDFKSTPPWNLGSNNITDRITEILTIPFLLETLKLKESRQSALTWYSGGEIKQSWNYRELLEDVGLYSANLTANFLIARGDRVLIISANSPHVILSHLAIMNIGAITVPIAPNESPAILRNIIENVSPKLILIGPAIDELLRSSLQQIEVPTYSIEALQEPQADMSLHVHTSIKPDDSAVIIFTSGTTSSPKGVTLSHYNLLINAEGLKRIHNLDSNHVHGCVLPLYHVNAFGFSMVSSIYAGCHLILICDQIDPNFWSKVQELKINVLSLVPNIINLLSKRKPKPTIKDTLKYVVSAAAPLTHLVALEFEENTGIPIHQGYGLSECTNFATSIPANLSPQRKQMLMSKWRLPSIGVQLFGTTVDIVDSDGVSLKAEQEGEIVISGHNIMKGYWLDSASTLQAFRGGVLHSGDLGFYIEEESIKYFFITGRIKDIIIRRGECLSPLQIENQLKELLSIGSYAVCGFPNDYSGEEIGLYINSDKEPSHTIIKRILDKCPSRYRPRMVVISPIPIPTSLTGKIQRIKLKAFFMEESATAFGKIIIKKVSKQHERI